MTYRKDTWLLPLLLVVALLIPTPAMGQDVQGVGAAPEVLSLDSLFAEISANNPSLRASRLEAAALARRGAQVSALPDPVIMIGYQPYPLLTARGTQRSQWRVEQAIPFPGKLGLQRDIADYSARVAEFEAETYAEDLLFLAKEVYYELYRIQRQENLIDAFKERLGSFEEVASTLYRVGTGMQQAILKAQLERNTLSRQQLDLDARRRTAAETLARILNRPFSDAFVGTVRVAAPEQPTLDESTLLAIAHRERQEISALDAAADRADAQIALARKQFKPDFGVNVTYFDIGAADIPPTATGRDALGVGVSIKVPLQRGRLRAGLEEARVRRNQVTARQEALATSFRTQIADLVSRLKLETQQLDLYNQALIPQAETTLQATLSAYSTGRTDFLDLLDAERMLFTLHSGYEDAFARYLKATAALERALGITSLQDIETP